MGFPFFIFIILFLLLAVVLNFGITIIRILLVGLNPFGRKKRKDEFKGYTRTDKSEESSGPTPVKSHKVFKETDGEYVDFEEIK